MVKGYIYLFECVSNYETSYKIGFTRNRDFKKRIINLQTGNKDKIKCIDFFETKHGRKLETTMHNLYSFKREGGEWFNLELRDVVNFKNTCILLEKNFDILEKNKEIYDQEI